MGSIFPNVAYTQLCHQAKKNNAKFKDNIYPLVKKKFIDIFEVLLTLYL